MYVSITDNNAWISDAHIDKWDISVTRSRKVAGRVCLVLVVGWLGKKLGCEMAFEARSLKQQEVVQWCMDKQ